jgi:hypothetical protein
VKQEVKSEVKKGAKTPAERQYFILSIKYFIYKIS